MLDGGQFVSEFVRDDHVGAVNPKIDDIRTQYPKTPASGWVAFATNGQKTSLLLAVSEHYFKLENIWADNGLDNPNMAVLYDGPGVSVTVGFIRVKGSDTVFIDGIKGVFVQSGLHASNVDSQLRIRVGGLLVRSQAGW